jgi:hypothetical protein
MTATVTVTNTIISGNARARRSTTESATIALGRHEQRHFERGGRGAVAIQNRPAASGNVTLGAGITDNGTGILVSGKRLGERSPSPATRRSRPPTSAAVTLTTNAGATVNLQRHPRYHDRTNRPASWPRAAGTLNVGGTANSRPAPLRTV